MAKKSKPKVKTIRLKYDIDLTDFKKKSAEIRKMIRLLKKELRSLKVA